MDDAAGLQTAQRGGHVQGIDDEFGVSHAAAQPATTRPARH
ncbi:hypothetical protein ACFCWG_34365 [Streptomyces sp. NPDC056390]